MNAGVSKKNFKEGSLTFKAQATFRAATTLEIAAEKPHDIPLHDWIKVNVAEFYNSTVTLTELLTETCTKAKCPEMTAGQEYVYLWAEDEYARNPTAMDAPEYISRLLVWAEKVIQNQDIFPEDDKKPPANFADVCDKLCRRLLRAPMHYYYHHGKELKEIGYEEYLDRLTLRYCIFALRFRLFKTKDRVLPILEVLKAKLPAQYVEMLMQLPDGMVK
uniref:Mob1/phocein family protein n=1 Tax=Arcella intermedia TaxID=1963864 RepID=A0A6B2LI73_9EUKA